MTSDKKQKKIKLIKQLSIGQILTGLITNGTLLNNKKITELESSEVDEIIISLDAFSEKTYNKTRRGLNFPKILENIDQVFASGYNKRLSQHRAAWVGNALKDKGVNVTSITPHPCGIAPGAPVNIRSKKHRLVQIVVEESKK